MFKSLKVKKIIFLFFILSLNTQSFADELKDGLHYEKITTDNNQVVHILKVDPKKLSIKVAHADGHALGLDTVANIAEEQNALAAINAGFFHIGDGKDGLPAGVLKINNEWYGIASFARGAIGWSEMSHDNNAALIDRIKTRATLQIGSRKLPIQAINQPGNVLQTILYTDSYGAKTNNSNVSNGTEAVIEDDEIVKIGPSSSTPIPEDGYVYFIGPKTNISRELLKIGREVVFKVEVIPTFQKDKTQKWQNFENIVAGIPLLLENGRNLQDKEGIHSDFITQPNARTAVGLMKNGDWLLAVVEKNQLGSPGMSIPELSKFLKEQGCDYALNLDGGSSSSLYINPTLNSSGGYSGEISRKIANAILILPKTKS